MAYIVLVAIGNIKTCKTLLEVLFFYNKIIIDNYTPYESRNSLRMGMVHFIYNSLVPSTI